MSEPSDRSPISDRAAFAPQGDGVYVFPPCCAGARVLVPIGEAVPGARLRPVCPRCGLAWLLELTADETTETGVRPVWTNLEMGRG